VTGVAGPGGGSAEKPVGLVHVAVAYEDRPVRHLECRFGDIGRAAIREATIVEALRLALDAAAG
jgi:nicotinamide-nucleotide amidase